MRTLIVGGGELSPSFLSEYLCENACGFIIAADSGLDVLSRVGRAPDLILGDYDSLRGKDLLERYREAGAQVEVYPCEKDFSDGESALREAVKRGSTEIDFLGACGGRLDHFLANVAGLLIPLEAGIPARIIDEQNEIFLADHSFICKKNFRYPYISLLAFSNEVKGLTLRGFKYPLTCADISKKSISLGISNEILEDTGEVVFEEGVLTVIRSGDRRKTGLF